jgi:Eco57I restriction-modification methylase
MNTSTLKTYAPQARKDFIQAVTDRAAVYGLTKNKTESITVEGDVAVIAGKAYPKVVAEQRASLEERIDHDGFDQVMEAVAYTWFNRFVAIRYMELHGYLDHGYRVLSNPDADKVDPEILEHVQHVDFPGGGLDKDTVVELKLDGTKDEELYRLLLVAQCNALHRAMPFLFERVSDETELLLPDNLLHSDSLIRRLVKSIDEADWQEVEIIGWIYQFYISDKKDEVIGKVVKSEDIPAATQLFTPNWIVKYLVQNSLGAQWLSTYPDSKLKEQMEYYIEPAEQTPEVQAQLKVITTESLNPEELTLMDPACGSGHILVEAYDLFKAIYQERGYRAKDIPQLILKKNLFGLEIDDRAAQLSSFALIMKARADDRRVLEGDITHNVRCIQSSDGLDVEAIYEALTGEEPEPLPPGEDFDFMDEVKTPLIAEARRSRSTSVTSGGEMKFSVDDVRLMLSLFKGDDAKTFGSLIGIPEGLAEKLPEISERTAQLVQGDDLNRQRLAACFMPIVQQSQLLGRQYKAVVTNPPYMGSKYMPPKLKRFAYDNYREHKADIFAVFASRSDKLVQHGGHLALMTPFVWMFLSSYEMLRRLFAQVNTITSLIRPEYHAFFESAYVPICAFSIHKNIAGGRGNYVDLTEFYGVEQQPIRTLEAIRDPLCHWRHQVSGGELELIPGFPLAYWISNSERAVFTRFGRLGDLASPRAGLATGDNNIFQRAWPEVSHARIGYNMTSCAEAAFSGLKWFPCNSGGEYRKWYGNNETIVNWENDGAAIRGFIDSNGKLRSRPQNRQYYFQPGVTWTKLSSSCFGARLRSEGFVFDDTGRSAFPSDTSLIHALLALMCSKTTNFFLSILSPTLSFTSGDIANLPVDEDILRGLDCALVEDAVVLARLDWDSSEMSWDFTMHPFLQEQVCEPTIRNTFDTWKQMCLERRVQMQDIEVRLNKHFINAYGLDNYMSPEVDPSDITLYNPSIAVDMPRLVSYAIGCMMGRYSLDEPGLIYANSGNEGFDPAKYSTFPSDEDGIVPLTDYEWFGDDATHRFVEFIGVAWPNEHLQENLKFVAESLGGKRGDQPRDTIRRYLSGGFYKDHLSTYKKRPIYWLFSSGKQQAFQALVYLHRYNAGTLSRMRTEYVIPLQGKMSARVDRLEADITAATSTSHRKKLEKERDKLKKQAEELREFDEKLRHYADQRITLDLDDGVKVNYGKFGDLLAEVKAITGKKPD